MTIKVGSDVVEAAVVGRVNEGVFIIVDAIGTLRQVALKGLCGLVPVVGTDFAAWVVGVDVAVPIVVHAIGALRLVGRFFRVVRGTFCGTVRVQGIGIAMVVVVDAIIASGS